MFKNTIQIFLWPFYRSNGGYFEINQYLTQNNNSTIIIKGIFYIKRYNGPARYPVMIQKTKLAFTRS